MAQSQPQQQGPQRQLFATANQLQQLVDQGTITPAVMAEQLAWQYTQHGLKQMRDEIARREAAQIIASKQQAAKAEVDQYIERVPDLRNRDSATMKRIASAASEIAKELGVPITDPIVQRSALRQELGRLDALEKPAPAPAPRDAASEFQRLVDEKGIPAQQVEYWRGRGYTEKRMSEEARFYRKRERRPA